MNAELLMQVKALDPAPADAELPSGMAPAHVVLSAIDERSRTVQTKERVDVIHPEPRRRWAPALVAAAAFVAVLAVGVVIWLVGAGDEAPVVTEPPTTTTVETSTSITDAPGAVAPPSGFASLEQGTYRLETFGTPFTFTVETSVFFVQENRSGFFALSPPNSRNPDDRDMVIVQLSALSDPAAPNAPLGDQGEGWPADDFGGWLDNLNDGVLITDRVETTLGGRDAIRVDLELGEIECPGDSFCARFDLSASKPLNPGVKYRIWVVDLQEGDPLAVILAITTESDRAWVDAYEQILSTLSFG